MTKLATASVALAAAAALGPTPCAAQVTDEPRVPITLTFSTGGIRRDTGLIRAAGQTTHRLIELGLVRVVPSLTEKGKKGIALRAAQLYFVSLPIATLTHVVSHEFGHVEYLRRENIRWDIDIEPWPWPVPVSGASVTGFGPITNAMGVISGGSEAAFVLETLVADRMHSEGSAHYFDAFQFIHAKLDTIVYTLGDLHPSLLDDADAFFAAVDVGDPRRFALEFELQRRRGEPPSMAAIRDLAGSLRARAATSLLDLTLAGAVINGFRYLITGERTGKPLAIHAGPLDLVPALHFTYTPAGYEHRASVRALSRPGQAVAYVRRITSPVEDHLTGGGASWSWRPHASLRATIKGDLWRTPAEGYGFALELGGERRFQMDAMPLHAGASIGYKTNGILEGHSQKSGLLLSLSGGFRF